jgi:hypothetical protein
LVVAGDVTTGGRIEPSNPMNNAVSRAELALEKGGAIC